MDPQATWEDLLAAYAESDWERVEELAEALLQWLTRGGFPPRATTGSDLGQDWDRAIAVCGARIALKQAREEGSHAAQR